ncbi:MAG: HNH endonuclease [Myxococcales bacterium]|nr:HNH endonuclease [Myxococcales bacterium]MBK7196243.1 HNH endonuclease [Myxococcales bacterium]MBP6848871.1 HNH endonuclease [Kofleriaceae bacterium]
MVDRAAGGQQVSEVAAAAGVAAAGADDWRVVDRTLRGLARRRAALDVEEAAWLRRARALGVHREFGFATFFEYVERVLGYAPGPARERLRVADALEGLPKLRAAMSAGDVAYSAARELTRVATVDTEAAWLTAAAKHTVREIEDMVSGRRRGDSPDDPPDPAARLHELRLLLPAAVLGKFTAARRALEAACGHPLTDGDLLATLCDGQLAGAGSHVEGAASASKPMYQIAVTRCPDCMRAWQDVAGHTIEISETELAQASCDAELLGRVDGDKPARVTKTIPPRTRRAVLRRDRGRCVVPGCRNARYVDVHHIVPRVEGGKHTPTKLAVMCSAHHKAAHDGRLRIEGTAPDKLRVTHADGRPYGAPPSHVRDVEAGASPPAGGKVADAPAQAGAEVEASPSARRSRRGKAATARGPRRSAKAGGRKASGYPRPVKTTMRKDTRKRPAKPSSRRHAA